MWQNEECNKKVLS